LTGAIASPPISNCGLDERASETGNENSAAKMTASNSPLIASINGKFLHNSWSVSSFGTSLSSSPTSSMKRSNDDHRKIRDFPFRPLRHSSANRIRADSLRRSMSWQSLNHDDLDKVSVCSKEDDSMELHKKVEQLKEHLEHLMEKQAAMDKRYNKVKDDNNNLVARVHVLEEQVSEVKMRGEERLEEERKRNKEEAKRLKREMVMEIENHSIRSEGLEKEKDSLHSELLNLKSQLEKARERSTRMEKKLLETQKTNEEKGAQIGDEFAMSEKNTEIRKNLSQNDSGMQICDEVYEDHPINARIQQLELEIIALRGKNINLIENYEEMQAKMLSRDLKEGKSLMNRTSHEKASSLADEFETMTQETMKRKMQEQRILICQLNNYIDNVLLRIMEKDPQILEVNRN